MSLLASVRLPYLHRSESASPPGFISKPPLLTLNFSSRSLLDSTLKDDASISPLYTITTVGVTTTIIRAYPGQKSVKTASIKWPKVIPAKNKSKTTLDGVLVQLKGHHWRGGESFLRPSTFKSGTRKFHLPYFSHSMKWQKQGTAYWCNSTPVKGPIAVFNPPIDQIPARLSVYETLHDERKAVPMLLHQGVSIFLLDYLLITAILLVSDPQEWILVQSTSSGATSAGDTLTTASLQLGATAHREPYSSQPPSLALRQFGFHSGPAISQQVQTPNFVDGNSLLQQIQPEWKSVLSFSSDEGSDDNSHSGVTRNESPSTFTESPFCPMPDNASIDPLPDRDLLSCYSDQTRSSSPLPVEPWPVERNASLSDVQDTRVDKRSTLISEPNHMAESPVGPSSLTKRRPSEPFMHAYSVRRPLPKAPSTLGGDSHVIRRVQSHMGSNENVGFRKPWLSKSPPPLPPIPLPTSPRTGRSLPPTPFDLSRGRSMGGLNSPAGSGVQVLRKSFDNDEDIPTWIQLLGSGEQGRSDSVLPRLPFEQLPPAYTSLDFGASHQQPWTRGS